MIELIDARGATLRLAAPPRRVVSLVPSTTETLFALGCGERVVGVTRFCVHPAEALAGILRVGGTKDLDPGRLEAARPDLVIGNAEENTREIFDEVARRWPLYVAFPRGVDEALADLDAMGLLLGAQGAAAGWRERVERARARLRPQRPWTFAYLIWRQPWMAAGRDTFISSLLADLGGVNAAHGPGDRYFTVEPRDLLGVDRVLLSSEPFPFKQRHVEELVEAGLPREALRLVDGELCSWHGVRMARAFEELPGMLGLGMLGLT